MLETLAERWSQMMVIRMVLGVALLFLVSLVMSCQELRYMISGKTVEARMDADQIEVTRNRAGDRHEQRVIRYHFTDKEKTRQEYAKVDMDWPHPEGKVVAVQYIAGRDMQSRLVGQHHYVWVAVFAGSIVLLGIGMFILSREK